MTKVFAFRPEPGLSRTIAAGREAGIEIEGAPLGEVAALPWDAPPARGYDGLLVGSANVFRHGGKALQGLRALPVHCVGEATAEAARADGFSVATTGEGGLQTVLDGLTGKDIRLLRLSGSERVNLSPTAKVEVDEIAVYEVRPLPLDESIAQGLPGGIALLHSAATARHLAQECDRLGVDRAGVAVAALGSRIAAAAGPGWAAIHSAERPDDAHLLALVSQICKTG